MHFFILNEKNVKRKVSSQIAILSALFFAKVSKNQ
jgi:hypothetical protein